MWSQFEVTQKQNILHKHELASSYTIYIPLFVLRICGTLYTSICDPHAAIEENHYLFICMIKKLLHGEITCTS